MPPEENKRLLAAYVAEVLQARRWEDAGRYVARDVRFHAVAEPHARRPAGDLDPFVLDFLRGEQPDAAQRYEQHKGVRPGGTAVLVERPGLEESRLLAAIPDLRFEMIEMIAEGETVVLRFRMSGHHTGAPFLGVPPAGIPLEAEGLVLYRFAEGKIVEIWPVVDSTPMLQRLGVLGP